MVPACRKRRCRPRHGVGPGARPAARPAAGPGAESGAETGAHPGGIRSAPGRACERLPSARLAGSYPSACRPEAIRRRPSWTPRMTDDSKLFQVLKGKPTKILGKGNGQGISTWLKFSCGILSNTEVRSATLPVSSGKTQKRQRIAKCCETGGLDRRQKSPLEKALLFPRQNASRGDYELQRYLATFPRRTACWRPVRRDRSRTSLGRTGRPRIRPADHSQIGLHTLRNAIGSGAPWRRSAAASCHPWTLSGRDSALTRGPRLVWPARPIGAPAGEAGVLEDDAGKTSSPWPGGGGGRAPVTETVPTSTRAAAVRRKGRPAGNRGTGICRTMKSGRFAR